MANTDVTTCVETPDKVLIRIVKANDRIFNRDKKYNFNEETKANLWQQIGAQLPEAGFYIPDPKARWKQLRDLFVRNDKNRNHKWIYFEDMSFMLGHIRHYAKPPTRNTQSQFVSYGIGNPHSSLNSAMHLGFQNVGDEASSSKPFLQRTPVLVAATSTYLVENEVRPPDVAALSKSACGSLGFNIQQHQSETTSDISEWQFIEHEQPMIFNEHEETTNDIQLPPSELTTNDIQSPSSEPTLETPLQRMSPPRTSAFPQTSVTPKTLTVDRISPPDCAIVEDSGYQFRNLAQSPLRSPSTSSGVGFEEIPPTNTGKKLKGPTTNVTPRTDRVSPNSLSRFSLASKKSPIAATAISSVRATNSANTVVEASRGSINLAKKKPPRTGEKRLMVVPPLDAFAQKKRKVVSKSEATEDAIIGCSNDLKEMSSEFKDLLRLKKQLIQVQLQGGPVQTKTPEKSQTVESGDGFFNLLQEEWIDLPAEIQDQLFPDILDIMEDFEVL